jgi:hypothetical protein
MSVISQLSRCSCLENSQWIIFSEIFNVDIFQRFSLDYVSLSGRASGEYGEHRPAGKI